MKEICNQYSYLQTSFEDIKEVFNKYLESLSNIYDNYLEEHILKSEFYLIMISGVEVGYFAIFKKSKLTQFYLRKDYWKHAQALFRQILEHYEIETAYVPTCDELFLSLCLDCRKELEMQAYFFAESGEEVRPAAYSADCLTKAKPEDLALIRSMSGDFFDTVTEDTMREEKTRLYILREKDDILGFGIIERCDIFTSHLAIGMFTAEKHRCKGVGRSIILHLKDICKKEGKKPVPGCWYYNHNSKSTLESAGFVSKTRLLNVKF